MDYKLCYFSHPPKKIGFKKSVCDRLLRRRKPKVLKNYHYPFFVYTPKRPKERKGFLVTDFGRLEESVHQFKKAYCKTIIVLNKKGEPV